jgi:hypothetical protein
MLWDEQISKAKKRLEESEKCHSLFGDHAEWIIEDKRRLADLERNKAKAIAFMDANGII